MTHTTKPQNKSKYKKVKMFDIIELRLDKGERYAFKNN